MRPRVLDKGYRWLSTMFFDPFQIIRRWGALPRYISNAVTYSRMQRDTRFPIRAGELFPCLDDRGASAGSSRGHYFHQDLWAARKLHASGTTTHVDVGSRIDGFIAHVLPFCRVTYVDLRPLDSSIDNLEFRQGTLASLPFEDETVSSLSCLHVMEHVGLGRYGDPVDPSGHIAAAKELSRILARDGRLLLGVPVGEERVCFDAHRVFRPETIVELFGELELREFSLIDDEGRCVRAGASFEESASCAYGCGLFEFWKSGIPE